MPLLVNIGNQIASINFQVINELTKPLASTAIIAATDNTIVMWGTTTTTCYIEKYATEMRIPLHRENGVYVMSVDLMVGNPSDKSAPFQRPA